MTHFGIAMSVDPVKSRIAIIGAGSVGSTCAYSLLLRPITAEILLVDTDAARLNAEVQDLSDAAFLSNTQVRAATPAEAGQCDIIVITAGAKQRPGETRSALIDRNHAILESVIGGMSPMRQDALLLLVSNPVDVLTYFALQMSGLPKGRVIGSGTFLDSIRLRSLIAGELEVARTAIHAYVLGEHGDSQMVAWSSATMGGNTLTSLLPPTSPSLSSLADSTKNKAYSIIAAKGATSFGVASAVSSLCETLLLDQRQVRPVSHWVERFGCCVSLPAVLGRNGIQKSLDVPLNDEEKKLFENSVNAIKGCIRAEQRV